MADWLINWTLWHWLILGFILLIGEVLTPGIFLQWAVVTDFETARGFGFDLEVVAEEGVTVALYDRFNLHLFFCAMLIGIAL